MDQKELIEMIKKDLDFYKSISVNNEGVSMVEFNGSKKHSIWIYTECECGYNKVSTPNNKPEICLNCKQDLDPSNYTIVLVKEKRMKRMKQIDPLRNIQCDYYLRVLLLGDPKGKEELIRKYTYGYSELDYKLTVGVAFSSKSITLKDKGIKITIWDFSGSERFRSLLSRFCRGVNGAIIIYDITNSNSLKHMPEWVQIIRENARNIPIMLIGNNLDLEQNREVSKEQIEKFRKQYDISSSMEISVKTGENVENMFQKFIEIILKELGHLE